jgi:hypothetical protein
MSKIAHATLIVDVGEPDLIKIFYEDGTTEKRIPTEVEHVLLKHIEWLCETE